LDNGRRRFLKSAQPPKVLARSARRSGGPISGRFEGGRPRGGRGPMRGAARRVVFRYDTIDAEGPRGWGVATRVARAREETRGTERDKKRHRLARRGKRRRPRRLRTGGLPRVPRGRASRAPSCASATGRIPHPRIVRLPHPRRSSSRVRLDAEEQTAGGITWDGRMHPREEEE
jgi:hypothetical protein